MLDNSIKNEKTSLVQENVFQSTCKDILIEAIKSQNPTLINYSSRGRVLKVNNKNNVLSYSDNQIRAYTPVEL